MLDQLNEYFNPHQIFLSSLGISYIDNSSFVSTNGNQQNQLVNIDNNPNALNVYIVNSITTLDGRSLAGTAVSIPSNHFIITNTSTVSTTMSHEAGHCFNLYHTHETAFGIEPISRSNCTSTGDLICDTPADPNLLGIVDSSCSYILNDGYNPLTNNIMSYSRRNCRDKFTNGQGWRMRQAIFNEPILQPLLNTLCGISNIEWDFENNPAVCLNQTKEFTLTNIPFNTNVNWNITSNLTLISSNSNSISVKLNSTEGKPIISGNVDINGTNYLFTLELEKLEIPSTSLISLESEGSRPIITGRFTNITARYNWVIDVGQIGYTWDWVVPSSQIRQLSNENSYIHVSPYNNPSSIYIKTQASNECGCTDWVGKWFSVETAPGGCLDCPTGRDVIHQY